MLLYNSGAVVVGVDVNSCVWGRRSDTFNLTGTTTKQPVRSEVVVGRPLFLDVVGVFFKGTAPTVSLLPWKTAVHVATVSCVCVTLTSVPRRVAFARAAGLPFDVRVVPEERRSLRRHRGG